MKPKTEKEALKTNILHEVIGTVGSITGDSVTLLCREKVTLKVKHENLDRWKHLLQPGKSVAVLKLDNGNIRVRAVAKDAGKREKMYIAFMGPPLAVLNIVCECGNTIRYGKDETGWFVEGAEHIIIHPEDWYKEKKKEESKMT